MPLTCLGVGTPSLPDSMKIRVDLSNMAPEASEVWTPLTGVYEVELDNSDEEHSGEVYVTVANHPAIATLYPFNRIRLVDYTKSPEFVFFIGRINQIKPVFRGALAAQNARGYAFRIYARDYMQALADNFVQADKMHAVYAFKSALDATYVPIYAPGASTDGDPGGQEPSPAITIIRDLVTRTGIIPDVTPTVTCPACVTTINLERNWMQGGAQTSVFAAITEMATSQPWSAANPPPGVGYTFRMAPPGQMGNGAVFQYFQRGQFEWDVTQVWGFQGATQDNRIPIQTFSATQEGRSIYSRSRVMGKGVSSYTAASTSIPSMESQWNPEEGLFRVTREATSNEEVLTQLNELQYRARGNLVADPDRKSFRGEKIGAITVVGIPTNAARVAPVAGDTIKLDPAPEGLENPEDDNKYVISSWHFEWPSGFSTYQLNRRPKARASTFNQSLMRRGLGVLSSLKDIYDSGWLRFDSVQVAGETVPADSRFLHKLGVVPRTVFVWAADTTTVEASVATGEADQVETAVIVERAHYDPILNVFVGFEVTATTKNHVTLNFYPLLAFSENAEAILGQGHGWLKKPTNTSIRVFILP